MYELSKSAFGKYDRYTLRNPSNGHAFSVVPVKGANLLDLYFSGKNILDGYDTPEALEAAKWGKSALLFPFPNRLDRGRYKWLGKRYEFPLNNAATENAIHGFVRDEAFEVEYVFLSKDHASIMCSFDYEGQRPYYPFPFSLDVEFMLFNDGRFTFEVTCLNRHREPIPVGFGWHPYFRLAEKADYHRMHLPACEKVAVNERMIPTGERSEFVDFQRKKRVGDTFLDSCFFNKKTSGAYKMTLEGNGQRVSVKASSRQSPYFQVFTPPHRDSIALEPMSCNVDAFNNGQGLVALAPGKEWKAKMEIAFNSKM
jgi:aldose 1-epimerase